MELNKKLVKEVTSRDSDFAKWYTDLCLKAELMEYSGAKGFIIYRPYGYAIWENIMAYLDQKFKETGHQNVYMPLVITESLFQKEKDHVVGFAPETAMITEIGTSKLAEKLIIRPTSETLFCEHYQKIISSYRDLPVKYNQWCSVVRWEKTTRPFLRGKEFLWQEGHTCHQSEAEAREETLAMLEIYKKLGKDFLAIPFVTGKKTEKEKFAGALETYAIEALMYDGQALQSGTAHYFGDEFAKAFDIKYQDQSGEQKFVYQTSWGVSTRLIGAIIMVHGDDNGLVLPPYVAPVQVVIIPISNEQIAIKEAVSYVTKKLSKKNIRYIVDETDKSVGFKYSKYEMRGVPIRLEIGKRELANGQIAIVKRYNSEKILVDIENIDAVLETEFQNIHNAMYQNALKHVENNTKEAKTYSEFKKMILAGGYVALSISGEEAELIIKKDTTATARVIPFEQKLITDVCPVTGKKALMTILFARAY